MVKKMRAKKTEKDKIEHLLSKYKKKALEQVLNKSITEFFYIDKDTKKIIFLKTDDGKLILEEFVKDLIGEELKNFIKLKVFSMYIDDNVIVEDDEEDLIGDFDELIEEDVEKAEKALDLNIFKDRDDIEFEYLKNLSDEEIEERREKFKLELTNLYKKYLINEFLDLTGEKPRKEVNVWNYENENLFLELVINWGDKKNFFTANLTDDLFETYVSINGKRGEFFFDEELFKEYLILWILKQINSLKKESKNLSKKRHN